MEDDIEDEDDLEPIFGGPDVVHTKWFNGERYFVMIYGPYINKNGRERYMHFCIPYAQYVLYKEKGITVKLWETIYHINEDITDDNIENLKVISNIMPRPIEVKYPYDPEKYNATISWHSKEQIFYVRFYPKNKFSFKKTKSLKNYIAETEILERFLNDDEKVIFKDGNKTNYDKKNLKVMKKGKVEYSKFPKGKVPFQNYHIGSEYINKRSGRKYINLPHSVDKYKILNMLYSRYRKQIIEGRFLTNNEEVDHKDGNKFNDSDDNLQILTKEEHRKKSIQEQKDMAPEVVICCDGCKKKFQREISKIRKRLKQNGNKSNNLFCSSECRWNYIKEHGQDNINYKELIKYICAGTGKEIELPENARFLPSRFNPDALPFYDRSAVLKWMKDKFK